MKSDTLIQKATLGFESIKVDQKFKTISLTHLKDWLTKEEFSEYAPQIEHIINQGHFDYLLDSFYQVIPFGTGGRRGEVGVGPNRINPWTIRSSAQGHSQFLTKEYGEEAKTRGVVLAFDIREFFSNSFFNPDLPNPVRNLTCKDLAIAAAQVYTANGIKIYIFDSFRTTPELSFAIRHLNCVSGDMFSASHNPPEHNGKKVFDHFGGQLVPPEDENLVTEVTNNIKEIKSIPYDQAVKEKLIITIGKDVDQAYYQAVLDLSVSDQRGINIAFTPLHGCSSTSITPILTKAGFTVSPDPLTNYPSGKFENVTFNIPNPEVIQSFDTVLKHAKKIKADIIINSDPDGDRVGTMVHHNNSWRFINGNEIAAILAEFIIGKKKDTKQEQFIIQTQVTTNLVTQIAKQNDITIINNLLVGFKFIGQEMNKLQQDGKMDNFLIGCEESHGYIGGDYSRDKDGAIAALWLCELAAELKQEGLTLIDYLDQIYTKYGYFRNYLTEIRLLGAEGMSKIQLILDTLREQPPTKFGGFKVKEAIDWLNITPIVSETDRSSKNGLVFHVQPTDLASSIKITVRPSGTEPKVKMYIELSTPPVTDDLLSQRKADIEALLKKVEEEFMTYCYDILGVKFPRRGFLLFWQLPLDIKMKYFQIEPQILELKQENDQKTRQSKLDNLLKFLGSDPIEKVDAAFEKKYKSNIKSYLDL